MFLAGKQGLLLVRSLAMHQTQFKLVQESVLSNQMVLFSLPVRQMKTSEKLQSIEDVEDIIKMMDKVQLPEDRPSKAVNREN